MHTCTLKLFRITVVPGASVGTSQSCTHRTKTQVTRIPIGPSATRQMTSLARPTERDPRFPRCTGLLLTPLAPQAAGTDMGLTGDLNPDRLDAMAWSSRSRRSGEKPHPISQRCHTDNQPESRSKGTAIRSCRDHELTVSKKTGGDPRGSPPV